MVMIYGQGPIKIPYFKTNDPQVFIISPSPDWGKLFIAPRRNFFGKFVPKDLFKKGTYLILVLLITHIKLWQYLLTGNSMKKCTRASFSKSVLGVLLAAIIKSNKHWDFIIYRVCNLLWKELWKGCYFS